MLHKLPNGTWLDLSLIFAIVPLPRHVRIMLAAGQTEKVETLPTIDEAHSVVLAEELAELVNAAKAKP